MWWWRGKPTHPRDILCQHEWLHSMALRVLLAPTPVVDLPCGLTGAIVGRNGMHLGILLAGHQTLGALTVTGWQKMPGQEIHVVETRQFLRREQLELFVTGQHFAGVYSYGITAQGLDGAWIALVGIQAA